MSSKFYLTTPIYYVNARPHIGHAYTTIVADVLARRHRLLGDDTWFLTGTDEHGQKIERSAAAADIPPQQFADEVSASFRTLWDRMGLTYDQYIRTTDEAHKRGVQKLFTTLKDNGKIYLDSYTGAYCVSDEAFVDAPVGTPCPDCGRTLEIVTEENYFFKLSEYGDRLIEIIEGRDAEHQLTIEPESRRNEVLSFLRSGLRDLSVSRSSFTWGIPVPKSSDTLGAPGLASETWVGAPQPPAQDHVIYVWLDALANYITAVGYGDDSPEGQAKFNRYWPADLHIVGKEIIRFHCVYWPAFLLAAGVPLPKKVVAHGWLLFDDSKMSKSKGNIVRTETILDAFGTLCPPVGAPSQSASSIEVGLIPSVTSGPLPSSSPNPEIVILSEGDRGLIANAAVEGSAVASAFRISSGLQPAESGLDEKGALAPGLPSKHHQDLFAADILRYFLLREIPFGQDGSFSFDALVTRYNADLANGYGNLVSRTLSMIQKYFDGLIPSQLSSHTAPQGVASLPIFSGYFSDNDFSRGLEGVWSSAIAYVDHAITTFKPWKVAAIGTETSREALGNFLYGVAESIRHITAFLYPVMPYATANVWRQLGLGDIEAAALNGELNNLQWGGLKPGTKLGPLSPIFPRADKGLDKIMAEMESPKDLTAITDNNDALTPASDDLPTAPIASKFVDETFVQAPAPTTTFDPAAGPRTTTLTEPSPGSQVAGSTASTTERDLPPTHNSQLTTDNSSPQIAIDDFIKIDLRVAKILVAERIPKADKLLRLEVDLGYEKRQILSGIAEHYTPEELIGRRIVVIVNLAPRKMRGLESHGMLLAASAEGGKPILATFPESEELPLGSRLK